LLPSPFLLSQPAPPTGSWHATLEPVPGLEVAFGLKVESKGRTLSGALVNGASESPVTAVSWDGESLTFELAHYDAKLVARREGDGLAGTFTRVIPSGKVEAPFRAARIAPVPPKPPKGSLSVTGDWGVEMGEGEKASRLLATFRQEGGRATGTLLGSTGDYGPMHGTWDGKALVLTVFDGVFIYRLDGTLGEGGSLSGTFRSRSGVPTPWKAKRLDAAGAAAWLPGGGSIVRAKDPDARVGFSFPISPGKAVSLDDPDLKDKPVVVAISGTWCPNCHDEAPVLEEIYRRYRGKGLAVVSLSYEYTEDAERSFRQIDRFRERHGVTYPILFAGTSKSASATAPISLLEGWKGYPTTLYLDRSHRIVKVRSGFDGPSTGARFAAQKKELEESVKGLLAR
ncbi:MAG TPA: TlpA disulfide reductase family protein, partial [Thermoanaerobaculia bacterium]|nr:TlpA disulfide reductase family protein [Thermoanaerobaculia bacterium]